LLGDETEKENVQYPNASEFFRRSEEESFFVYLTTVRCTLTTPARFCDGCPDGCSASILCLRSLFVCFFLRSLFVCFFFLAALQFVM